MSRCHKCDERLSDIDPVHVCSSEYERVVTAPTAPTAPLLSLLSCPFCGMAPEFKVSQDDNIIGVVCPEGSPCRGAALFVCFDSTKRESAIEAWNRRSDAALLAMQRERDDLTIHVADLRESLDERGIDLDAKVEIIDGLREQLAASERTCAELLKIDDSRHSDRLIALLNEKNQARAFIEILIRELRRGLREWKARAEASERTAEGLRERTDVEVCCAQAVEFAEYVTEHAKGKMVEAAKRFLSLPYSKELAAKLKHATELARLEGERKE